MNSGHWITAACYFLLRGFNRMDVRAYAEQSYRDRQLRIISVRGYYSCVPLGNIRDYCLA